MDLTTSPRSNALQGLTTIERRLAVADLAARVDRDGLDAHLDAVLSLALAGGDYGVSAVITSVMTGRDEPAVARLRAFGRVAAVVAHATPRPAGTTRTDLARAA